MVTLDGSASSDANKDTLTYSWTLTGKPAGSAAVLSSSTAVKPSFTADLSGAYVASLVVSDGEANSGEATVNINAAHPIAAWGDSLTPGYVTQLRTLFPNRTIFNGGVGGQTSTQIAGRQGGVIPLWTIEGNVIPESGGVKVTAQSSTLHNTQGPGQITGVLDGIPGVFSFDKVSTYTFTRTTPGLAKIVEPGSPFFVDVFNRNTWVNTFWYGRNNTHQAEVVKFDISASVNFLSPGNNQFIVFSILNGDRVNESVGEVVYQRIMKLNQDIQNIYPQNYIDIRSYLVSQYDPSNPQDVIDFQNDVVPSSLRRDNLHLNNQGSLLVAKKVAEFITMKGW